MTREMQSSEGLHEEHETETFILVLREPVSITRGYDEQTWENNKPIIKELSGKDTVKNGQSILAKAFDFHVS